MKIHPTAIVSTQAQLADDVEVGAHAIIGENVKLGAGCVVQARGSSKAGPPWAREILLVTVP
jgi:acyl-[acyl carrier protein]--UDP-N-acetylglucosamine O-acyltransferase